MAWQDRLASWVDHQVQRQPALDSWLEKHFHAMGMHGPEVRHLLKARFLPIATLVSALALALLVTVLVRRASRARARRRRAAPQAG